MCVICIYKPIFICYLYIHKQFIFCLFIFVYKIFVYIQAIYIYKAHFSPCIYVKMGFPGGSVAKNLSACRNHRRLMFCPWVRKLPWRRAWQLTPVFLPGESHRQRAWQVTVNGVTNKSDTTK